MSSPPAQQRVPIEGPTAELWARTDAVGFLRAWTTGEVSQGEHAGRIGNLLTEVPTAGVIVMEWIPTALQVNLSGGVHGGFLALVCDEAGGLAASSLGERFGPMLTLDLDVTFLRPAQLGRPHRVEGRVVHAGRVRIVSDVTVHTEQGALAATARGSFLPHKTFAERLQSASVTP